MKIGIVEKVCKWLCYSFLAITNESTQSDKLMYNDLFWKLKIETIIHVKCFSYASEFRLLYFVP